MPAGDRQAPEVTLWEAFELTLNLHWRGSKNEEGASGAFMATIKVLGPEYAVERIDNRVVTALIEGWKRDGQAGGTVNRKLAALSKVCKTAHAAGMTRTPPPTFPRLREAPHRTRTVSDAELRALCEGSGEDYRPLWLFLADTGLRVGEAVDLEFRDWRVDLNNGQATVTVRESKSGSPRTVPLTKAAAAIVLRLAEQRGYSPENFIFGVTQRGVNAEWDSVRKMMDLQDDEQFVPHALRHTCATNLVKRGVPLAVVQRWLGHKTIAVTMRYAHVGDAQVFDAVKALEGA